MKIRLDKYLAVAGVASRSRTKTFIKQKRVFVNSVPQTDPKFKVDTEEDVVEFNHKMINYKQYTYLLLNKPKGYVCANKDNLHPTVFDLIEGYEHKELFVVGRLDKDTTGLVLLTNDGQWAHKMKSPNSNTDKEYLVTLEKTLDDKQLKDFVKPMELDGKKLKSAYIQKLTNNICKVVISEGKHHQVKRMFRKVNNEVKELHRTRIKNIVLSDFNLELGNFIEFEPNL